MSMGAMAQLNTDRITAIGRNALYFDDYVLSIQYFNQVIKLKPYLSEPYMLRAIAKIQLGDYTGAELDCNAAIERNPFSLVHTTPAALSIVIQGNWKKQNTTSAKP